MVSARSDSWRENEARRFMEREGGNVAGCKMVNSRHLERLARAIDSRSGEIATCGVAVSRVSESGQGVFIFHFGNASADTFCFKISFFISCLFLREISEREVLKMVFCLQNFGCYTRKKKLPSRCCLVLRSASPTILIFFVNNSVFFY